jgi:hypothetical protein
MLDWSLHHFSRIFPSPKVERNVKWRKTNEQERDTSKLSHHVRQHSLQMQMQLFFFLNVQHAFLPLTTSLTELWLHKLHFCDVINAAYEFNYAISFLEQWDQIWHWKKVKGKREKRNRKGRLKGSDYVIKWNLFNN